MLITWKKVFDLQGCLLDTNILKFIITYRTWLQVKEKLQLMNMVNKALYADELGFCI